MASIIRGVGVAVKGNRVLIVARPEAQPLRPVPSCGTGLSCSTAPGGAVDSDVGSLPHGNICRLVGFQLRSFFGVSLGERQRVAGEQVFHDLARP